MSSKHPSAQKNTGVLKEKSPTSRLPAWVFFWAVVVFIIYGSLFPFDFQAIPAPFDRFLDEWHLFQNIPDVLDNFLLFVPLGIALHACFSSLRARIIASFFSILILAFGIQLVQLYLPSRTASLSDAFWNTVGMGVGLLIAARVWRALQKRLIHAGTAASQQDYFPMLLVLCWFFYESFPFVPTLDIGLLREHVKSAVFAPPFELMRLSQHWLAATLAGCAVLKVHGLRPRRLNLMVIGAAAIFMEVFVAYGSLRRETLLGISLGLCTAYGLEIGLKNQARHAIFWLALSTYLLTIFTPYRAQPWDASFTFTPFSNLLWHGITKDIPPVAFETLAIGIMMWSGSLRAGRKQSFLTIWVVGILALLSLLEVLRVFFVGYHGDTTPLIVALVLSPFALSASTAMIQDEDQVILPASTAQPERENTTAHLTPLPQTSNSHLRVEASIPLSSATAASHWRWLLGSSLTLTLALWILLHLPGIPYNLKKIFGDQILLGASIFSLVLLWLGMAPWWLAQTIIRRNAQKRHILFWIPLALLAMALISLGLLYFSTPEIMLNKIIGAPDLYRRVVTEDYWGDVWRLRFSVLPQALVETLESSLRYCALYSLFMIPLTLAALALPKTNRPARLIGYSLFLAPFWYAAKLVVIDNAITDNLVELIAPNGNLFLVAIIILLALHASLMAEHLYRARTYLKPGLMSLVMLLLSWYLLNQGIDTLIVKDGLVFSGIQFILGENRTAPISEISLFIRWCLLYTSAVAVIVMGMLLAMRIFPAASLSKRRRRSKTKHSSTSNNSLAAE
ncbi:VanZ family protein [Undibacterium sp.]|uniref:VanZ family protein n=1 Tax=Undibacterium sp. TaxID=1914977 RepID=UPI0025D1D5E4|nr:VanZ family protein [Undibacterium sp.]